MTRGWEGGGAASTMYILIVGKPRTDLCIMTNVTHSQSVAVRSLIFPITSSLLSSHGSQTSQPTPFLPFFLLASITSLNAVFSIRPSSWKGPCPELRPTLNGKLRKPRYLPPKYWYTQISGFPDSWVLSQIDMSRSCQVRKRRLASFLAHKTSKQ